jgi:hypothetical protein
VFRKVEFIALFVLAPKPPASLSGLQKVGPQMPWACRRTSRPLRPLILKGQVAGARHRRGAEQQSNGTGVVVVAEVQGLVKSDLPAESLDASAFTYILDVDPKPSSLVQQHPNPTPSLIDSGEYLLNLPWYLWQQPDLPPNLPSCLDRTIHTRQPRRRGISPPTVPAVLSAALQTQMKTGPRFPT